MMLYLCGEDDGEIERVGVEGGGQEREKLLQIYVVDARKYD